jgi:2-isopropylmalate synthase
MIPIQIYDTTLRDGEQAPGASMDPVQKLLIAQALETLGVDTIEAGFPAASPEDAGTVATIAAQCRNSRIAAFARACEADIQVAGKALKVSSHSRITLVIPVSDLHIRTKLGCDPDTLIELLKTSIRQARNVCGEVEIILEDATRATPELMARICRAAALEKIQAITIADTVGYSTPSDISLCFKRLFVATPEIEDIVLGIHCHDDLGLATINTLTGLQAGARQAHCTVNGIGERAGNAALEEVVMATTVRSNIFSFSSRIDTTKLWQTSRLVSDITGFAIPPNKAIVGSNVFAHGSGIHQDGILKLAQTYEIFPPELIGAPPRSLPLTRLSGRAGLMHRLKELGVNVSRAEAEFLFKLMKSNVSNLASITPEGLRALLLKIDIK